MSNRARALASLRSVLRIRCARKVERPSRASINSVVVDDRATASTTVGPQAAALHRLEAPMIREENSLRRPGSARALSAGYKTNCSAQSRPTSTAVDSGLGDTTMAAWSTIATSLLAQAAQVSAQTPESSAQVSVVRCLHWRKCRAAGRPRSQSSRQQHRQPTTPLSSISCTGHRRS